jgi:hypothetical protein
MLKDMTRPRWALAWCAAVIVFGACRVVAGAALTLSNGELLLVTCLVPPAVMLLVWRDAPITVAELLYDVNRPSEEAQS